MAVVRVSVAGFVKGGGALKGVAKSWLGAMPQIKEVMEHYQGKAVVVPGMNTDHEERDARFVVDKLQRNCATTQSPVRRLRLGAGLTRQNAGHPEAQ